MINTTQRGDIKTHATGQAETLPRSEAHRVDAKIYDAHTDAVEALVREHADEKGEARVTSDTSVGELVVVGRTDRTGTVDITLHTDPETARTVWKELTGEGQTRGDQTNGLAINLRASAAPHEIGANVSIGGPNAEPASGAIAGLGSVDMTVTVLEHPSNELIIDTGSGLEAAVGWSGADMTRPELAEAYITMLLAAQTEAFADQLAPAAISEG